MNSLNLLPVEISQRLLGLDKKVVLTYDNTKMTDGAGAQLQRIYGTYSVSRLLGVRYLHTPVSRVDNQGFSALERNLVDPNYHQEINKVFQVKSDVMPTSDFHRVELPNISVEDVERLAALFDAGGTGGRPSLVQLVVPFGIADRFPDCYEVCKEISPFEAPPRRGRPLRVALHLRRGELLAVAPDRMLPNGYYVNVAQNLAQMLEARGIDYQIELHTEMSATEFILSPGYPGIPDQIQPTVITPEMSRLDDFRELPNLIYCINDTAIDCLRKLATADVLVMSRSSFSYVAAILNKAGIILYYPFWHFAPSSWLTVEPDGQFDRLAFGEAVENLRGASPVADTVGPDAAPHEDGLVGLPPNRYLPIGSDVGAMSPDGTNGELSASRICISGWRRPENWGVWADGPVAVLRFRTDLPSGTKIHLILRLVAPVSEFRRIRISSGSGAEIDVALAGGTDRLAVISCNVEAGGIVYAHLSMAAENPTAATDVVAPYCGLKGILYIQPGRPGVEAPND
jgi:hypothetical protein